MSENKTAYLIKYGQYADTILTNKVPTSEESMIMVVRDELQNITTGRLIDVSVDFKKEEINYTYKDCFNEIESGKLYFDKLEIVDF